MIKHLTNIHQSQINSQQKLTEYKKKMKIFIKEVEKEVSLFIDKYQNKIKELERQIIQLKIQLKKKNTKINIENDTPSMKQQNDGHPNVKKNSINLIEELATKTFSGSNEKGEKSPLRFPTSDSKFEIYMTPQKMGQSRFETSRLNSKRRQEDLVNSLQNGKANLDLHTTRMFDLVRKSNIIDRNNVESQVEEQLPTDQNKKIPCDDLNTSLGQICNSLDSSFHGRKAQIKSQKKRQQKYVKQEYQRKKQNQVQIKKKQQGIKNLLATMRKNIEISPSKSPQVIKISKLLTNDKIKNSQQSSKSRVMINPIPVDITNRSKTKQQNSAIGSQSKNPPSILKNSSGGYNILSKSIQNISAIQFHDSGIFE